MIKTPRQFRVVGIFFGFFGVLMVILTTLNVAYYQYVLGYNEIWNAVIITPFLFAVFVFHVEFIRKSELLKK